MGQADWHGQIVIKENPQYELAFSANQLDIQKLSAKDNAIKGQLNLEGMINGSGLTLATMNAQAKVILRKSTIGEVNFEQGTLTATVANQRIRVSDEGSLKAADTMLTIRGDIGTDLKQQGKLDYQLRVGNLSPWLALIDHEGSGALVLVGQAQGNLSDLKAQGKITASSLIYRGPPSSAPLDYDLGYSSVRPLPYGTVNLSLFDVRNGYRLQTIAGVVRIPSEADVIELNAKARDAQGRTHTAGNVKYQPELLVAQLTQLSLDLPNGLWRLFQPVTVTQRGPDFMVDRFSMRNNVASCCWTDDSRWPALRHCA